MIDTETILRQLGQRLRAARLERNETQEVFGARLGLSRQSVARMEQGRETVPIGCWLEASAILGRLGSWDGVLAEPIDLFEHHDQQQTGRQRASGRREEQNE